MGDKEPFDDERLTHGICPSCYEWAVNKEDISSLSEYLDTFTVPVIIVNDQGRIIAVNKDAETALGRSQNNILGLLGGEAMECDYARLPEGCGQTIHCPACTIRNLVEKTIEKGRGFTEQVQLKRNSEILSMTATTDYLSGKVSIKLSI